MDQPKKRLAQDTVVVLMTTLLMTLFLLVVDLFWGWLLSRAVVGVLPGAATGQEGRPGRPAGQVVGRSGRQPSLCIGPHETPLDRTVPYDSTDERRSQPDETRPPDDPAEAPTPGQARRRHASAAAASGCRPEPRIGPELESTEPTRRPHSAEPDQDVDALPPGRDAAEDRRRTSRRCRSPMTVAEAAAEAEPQPKPKKPRKSKAAAGGADGRRRRRGRDRPTTAADAAAEPPPTARRSGTSSRCRAAARSRSRPPSSGR